MISCSSLVIIRKYTEYAVFGLIGVVITQALGYGLIFDLNFFLRNLSVMGGLLMVLSDSWVRKKFAPAGLPLPAEKDRKKYIQLAGRILLILLFVGFIWSGDWGIARILVSLFGLVACVMVVVGFKAKWSAILLVVILSVFNLVVNNFWTVRDYFRKVIRRGTLIWRIAARTSPAQRLRQIRLFPDSLYCVSRALPITATSKLINMQAAVSSCWLTWVLAPSVLTRRRRYIDLEALVGSRAPWVVCLAICLRFACHLWQDWRKHQSLWEWHISSFRMKAQDLAHDVP